MRRVDDNASIHAFRRGGDGVCGSVGFGSGTGRFAQWRSGKKWKSVLQLFANEWLSGRAVGLLGFLSTDGKRGCSSSSSADSQASVRVALGVSLTSACIVV